MVHQLITVAYLPIVLFAMWGCKGLSVQWLSLKYSKLLRNEIGSKSYSAQTIPREILAKFKSKIGQKIKSLIINGGPLSEVDWAFALIPNDNVHRLRSPQAYPNHIEPSIVILPSRDYLANGISPFTKFVLYHELEHCTSHSVIFESDRINLPLQFLLTSIFITICIPILPYILLSVLLFLLGLYYAIESVPQQCEMRTDLRALGHLSEDEIKAVLPILENNYKRRGKKNYKIWQDPTSSLWQKITARKKVREAYLADMSIQSIKENLRYTRFIVTSGSIASLGNRSYAGPFFALPIAVIIYIFGTNLKTIPTSAIAAYSGGSLLLLFISGLIGLNRERLALQIFSALGLINRK